MAGRNNPGDSTSDRDFTDKLTQMGDRTSLMIIDATLKSLPSLGGPCAESAGDVAALARRMLQATRDYRDSLLPETESRR